METGNRVETEIKRGNTLESLLHRNLDLDRIVAQAEEEAGKELNVLRQWQKGLRAPIAFQPRLEPPPRFVFENRGVCAKCGIFGATKIEKHHIFPRWAGGTDEPDNLIYLCPSCHKKQEENFRRHFLKLVNSLKGTRGEMDR